MRPVLFEIPLPALGIPLGSALSLLAFISVLVGWYAYRKRTPDVLVLALVAAVSAAAGAVVLRGQTYRPSPVPVMSYGFALSASLAAGWALTLRLADRAGLGRDVTAHAYVVAAIGGLLGARALYVLTNLAEFQRLSQVVALTSGGLTAYGGFLGGFIGSWWALRRLGVPFLPWADVAAPSVALGVALTRLGCYLHGCDFGRPLAPTAFGRALGTFPRWAANSPAGSGSPAWLDQVMRAGLSPSATESLPVHPTELYESALGLALLGLALVSFKRRRFAGELFYALGLGYGAGRFVIEFFRDDVERGHFGPALSGLVWIVVFVLALGAALRFGPWAERFVHHPRRAALLVAALLLVVVVVRTTAFGRETAIALSTSQWLGLATVLVVAALGRRSLLAAAQALPEPALGRSN